MTNQPDIETRIKVARKLFLPKGPVCEKICGTCPFHTNGKGYARDHEDFPSIVQSILLGFPFYCHQTVLFDERTTFVGLGENRTPFPHVQPHFMNCKGAVLLKRGEIPNPLEADGNTTPPQPETTTRIPLRVDVRLPIGRKATGTAKKRPAKARTTAPKTPSRVRVLPKHRNRA